MRIIGTSDSVSAGESVHACGDDINVCEFRSVFFGTVAFGSVCGFEALGEDPYRLFSITLNILMILRTAVLRIDFLVVCHCVACGCWSCIREPSRGTAARDGE